MATHSSVLVWRIPGTREPGGLPSMGLHRVGHDWSDLAAAAAAGSFPVSHVFASRGQIIEVSASASVLPMNIQDWSLGWTGWISLQFKGLSRVFSSTTSQKHEFLSTQPFLWLNSPIHDYWKNHSFEYTDLVSKVMSLLFNMLSRFVITGEGNGKPL